MIHISQEELLKKIEQEHKQLFESEQTSSEQEPKVARRPQEEAQMSSILPATCGSLRDRNNNSISSDEDEIQAVLITGKRPFVYD